MTGANVVPNQASTLLMPIPVSILICTRNRAGHLRSTLQSVSRLAVPEGLDPELVVVDNGSVDQTSDVLDDPPVQGIPVTSVVEPKKGVSHARNTAIRTAQGHVLLWLDDDVRVPQAWLKSMAQPILRGDADAVAGKVVLPSHLKRDWMEPFHRKALASTEAINPESPKDIFSGNMAFSRSVLENVPGFDPELGPGSRVGALEDVLFSWQVREAGYEIGMVTEIAVEHHFDEGHLTRGEFVRTAIARGKSLAYIHYHWSHRTQAHWTHRQHAYEFWRHPYVVLAKRFIDRELYRGEHCVNGKPTPINSREFWTIMNAYGLWQYLIERRRSRNYEKRGLNKIHGERATLKTA